MQSSSSVSNIMGASKDSVDARIYPPSFSDSPASIWGKSPGRRPSTVPRKAQSAKLVAYHSLRRPLKFNRW